MSTIEKMDISRLSFQEVVTFAEQALDTENDENLNGLLDALAEKTGNVVSGRHPSEISDLRGDLARLRRRIERGDDSRAERAATALHLLGLTLDAGLTTALLHDAEARRTATQRVLRDRILHELASHGPLRPSELAKRLDTGPSQISRCLKRLQEEQLIEAAPNPDSDGRANVYRLRTSAMAVAA